MITVAEALRRPYDNFTLLRLLLAIAVVVSHAGSVATGSHADEPLWSLTGFTLGEHAVNGFFAVSGFLVAMSWDRRGGILPFAAARILRVYPGLVVATLFTALVLGGAMTRVPAGDYLASAGTWDMIWRTVSVFKSATTLPGVFERNPLPWPLATVWTLRYEMFCYGGLLAFGALGGFRKPWIALVGAAALALALVALAAAGPIPKGRETALRLPLVFACGGLLYLYRDRLRIGLSAAVGAGVAVLIGGLLWEPLYRPLLFAGTAYLAIALAIAPGLAHPALEPRHDISYGIYLYGWPVQQTLTALAPGVSGWTLLPAALAATAVLALLSWLAVEKPALGLKNRLIGARRL